MYRNIFPLNLLPDTSSGLNVLNIKIKDLVMGSSHSSREKNIIAISAKEMRNISKKISHKFSPVPPIKSCNTAVKKKISGPELLKISQNINLYFAPKAVLNKTKLALLSVDPRHIYVYWNLCNNNTNTLLQSMHNNELLLRIYSQPIQGDTQIKPQALIEVPVHNFQSQQNITVPKVNDETTYSAHIGKIVSKNEFTALLSSNELHISKDNTRFNSSPQINNTNFISEDSLSPPVEHHSFSNSSTLHYAGTNHSGHRKQ